MPLNKSKGKMYPWVTHTWNVIKGKCPHDCSYCYMKRFKQPELHFDESELKTDLGQGNFIFVGSSCDDFAIGILRNWIESILWHCWEYADNRYLFQSKNPQRFNDFDFPPDTILGTTLESNHCCCDFTGNAPCISERYFAMLKILQPKMISIEPIMDFDTEQFAEIIVKINPQFVSIGADNYRHNLPEPSWDKVQSLIKSLEQTGIKVIQKDGLERLRK